jgi:hypothetical protein
MPKARVTAITKIASPKDFFQAIGRNTEQLSDKFKTLAEIKTIHSRQLREWVEDARTRRYILRQREALRTAGVGGLVETYRGVKRKIGEGRRSTY